MAVTQRRTMEDFAQQMRWLVDEAYPEVEVVRVVLDNLNTHRMSVAVRGVPGGRGPADCQTAGVPLHPQARELVEYGGNRVQRTVPLLPQTATPRRGPALGREVQALVTERNTAQATINWRFNTHDARTKLHRLYPFLIPNMTEY